MTTNQDNIKPWVAWMARNRKLVSYILLALALPLAGLAIWWGTKISKESGPLPWDMIALTFWASISTLIVAGSGLYQLLNVPEPSTEHDNARLLFLGFTGLIG